MSQICSCPVCGHALLVDFDTLLFDANGEATDVIDCESCETKLNIWTDGDDIELTRADDDDEEWDMILIGFSKEAGAFPVPEVFAPTEEETIAALRRGLKDLDPVKDADAIAAWERMVPGSTQRVQEGGSHV